VIAVAAAGIESVARTPGIDETPWSYRVQSAASAPFLYLWHTIAPVSLTPLDVLPVDPVANPFVSAAALLCAGGCVPGGVDLASSMAGARSGVGRVSGAAGPSGRAGAERPAGHGRSVHVSAGCRRGHCSRDGRGALGVRPQSADHHGRRRYAGAAGGPGGDRAKRADAVVRLARVVDTGGRPGSRQDVGLYNLGSALAAAGREDEAAARYREVLALQPGHADARANLARLDAARFEREGNDRAARGDMEAAAERYRQAVALDPKRTHSQAGLGMALATLGRHGEAIPFLRAAIRQGVPDAEVPNALGVLLLQAEQTREAVRYWKRGWRRTPTTSSSHTTWRDCWPPILP